MKVIKYLLFAIGGLVLLAVIALAVAIAVVDGAFVKERATRILKEDFQRTLTIEGTPRLSLFPSIGLELGKTRLSERASDKEFLSLDSLKAAVRLMPLLSGSVHVDALSLAGLKLSVVRAKDGTMNFADLAGGRDGKVKEAGKDAGKEDRQAKPPEVRVASLSIERTQVVYRDEASGQAVSFGEINLKTGALADATPTPVAFSAIVKGVRPTLDVKLNLAGQLRLNLDKQAFEVAGLVFDARGVIDRDSLSATLSAPQVSVTPGKATGSAVTASLSLKGPQRNVNARLSIAAVEGTAAALSIPALVVELDALAEGNGIKGRIETPIKASLSQKTWELPKLLANLTFSGPMVPQKSVTLPIQASLKADLARRSASAEVSTKFDESTVRAKFDATKLEPLQASFDINVDRINLDRYLPKSAAKEGAKSSERIDYSPLKGPTVSGQVQAGALQVKGVKLENLKANMKLAGGRLEISPYTANLYGGSLNSNIVVDANTSRLMVKHAMSGVNLGPLLRDAVHKDILEGKGNLVLDLSATGNTEAALKKSLSGTARVDLKDGAIKGINLAENLRNVKATLGSKSAQSAGDSSKKTDFSEMSASFVIKDGVARNDDLKAASPFLRLGGAGSFDLGNSTIDYTARATLAATSKGQGGAADAAGVTVPVKLGGTFDAPTWIIDYTALIGQLGSGAGKLGGAVGGLVGGAAGAAGSGSGQVKDKLKGLFGR
jgi:AsmA protein